MQVIVAHQRPGECELAVWCSLYSVSTKNHMEQPLSWCNDVLHAVLRILDLSYVECVTLQMALLNEIQ